MNRDRLIPPRRDAVFDYEGCECKEDALRVVCLDLSVPEGRYTPWAEVQAELGSDTCVRQYVAQVAAGMLSHMARPPGCPESLRPQHWAAAAHLVWRRLGTPHVMLKPIVQHAFFRWAESVEDPARGLKNFMSGFDLGNIDSLQRVIDEFLFAIMGFPEDEICGMWRDIITARFRKGMDARMIRPFWKDLRVRRQSAEELAEPTIRELVMDLMSRYVRGHEGVEMDAKGVSFGDLLALVDSCWRTSVCRPVAEEELELCLSKGELGTVDTFLRRYGPAVGISAIECKEWFVRLARGACPKAEQRCRFGIAAALADLAGDRGEEKRLRALARERLQPVELKMGSKSQRGEADSAR